VKANVRSTLRANGPAETKVGHRQDPIKTKPLPALLVRGFVFIDLGEQLKSTTIVFLGLVRVLAAITPTIAPMPMRYKIIPVNDLFFF
jgi:hypothetical protein